MSDPPSYDQDLLSRLNALKKSSISSLDQSKPEGIFQPSKPANPESDLSARLRSLRNASALPSTAPVYGSGAAPSAPPKDAASFPSVPRTLSEDSDPLRNPIGDIDDKSLDELLAELGPDDQWTLNPDDPEDIQKLLDEAKTSLPPDGHVTRAPEPKSQAEGQGQRRWDEKYLTKDIDFSVFTSDNEDDDADTFTRKDIEKGKEKKKEEEAEADDESREADEIVRRMLDEIASEPPEDPKPVEAPAPSQGQTVAKRDEDSPFSLPSAPSDLPSPAPQPESASRKSVDFDSDISARLAALKGFGSFPPTGKTDDLGLPSAPKFKPSEHLKQAKVVAKQPTYTDEEIDTWCVICQDDATVRCLGCDGDLYCANCWKEGHMGPDAGSEEKGHKWTKYRKPN